MATDTAQASSQYPRWTDINVFLPPDTAGPSRMPPFPADEPKPTPDELKKAFAGHIAQRNGPDAPLMTKAMREREEARLGVKKKEYSEIRVRIRFSDRTTLEGLFPASTQIPTLYDFVRAHLAPRYAANAFTIYQSPPKRDLLASDAKLQGKTIKDLGMAPAAIVNVHWSDSAMNSNSFAAPLDPSVLSSAKDLPVPPSFDSSGSSPARTHGEEAKGQSGAGEGAKKAR